jgi:NAD(P)-dependent dehydrogenase (short-subunit alcohol dehydrogenase family)/acyl dehydratase/putative sterol carrier protein
MALNMNAIGKKIGPDVKQYDWKDVVLYALGVGAGFDELDYVYEKNLKVIPTFSIATIFDFLSKLGIETEINLAGLLHGEQELIFHNPIPTSGKFVTQGSIKNYYDLGQKGALVIGESMTRDANNKKLFTSRITLFARKDGGFGGQAPPKETVEIPDRKPDFEVKDAPGLNQPLVYRLSGDLFMVHVDPEFAKMAGFARPIMHGLCTFGFATRHCIKSLCPGQPDKVRRLKCRFSKPLMPGDPIKTLIWKIKDGLAYYRVVNTKTGETVVDNGIFEWGALAEDLRIRYDGRVAVVTGAGGGLGRAYAIELAKRGCKVVVNDLGGSRDGAGGGSATPAQKVVDEIKAMGGEAVPNYDNVATPEGGAAIVKSAIDAWGRIDILINNAGILRDKTFLKMEPENWNAVLNVHLNGAYHVTSAAWGYMRDQGFGRVIMTTSAAGIYGNFGQANYAAAKGALVGFMNTLKLEGKKYNVLVNTVAPVAASRLTEDVFPPDVLEKSKPEFVAPIVLYLCSDQCKTTGNIYNAGMGFFNRAAVFTGPGAVLGKEDTIPTVDDVAAGMGKIKNLADAKEYYQLNDQVMDVVMAFQRPAAAAPQAEAAAPQGFATVPAIFEAMPTKFQADKAAGVDVVFQFIITGEGGGGYAVTIKDQKCGYKKAKVEKPTCTLEMGTADFISMMNGKLPAMQAYTSGKLKISGDVMKSQLIEKVFKM